MSKFEDLGVPAIDHQTGEEIQGVTIITSETLAAHDMRRKGRLAVGITLIGIGGGIVATSPPAEKAATLINETPVVRQINHAITTAEGWLLEPIVRLVMPKEQLDSSILQLDTPTENQKN